MAKKRKVELYEILSGRQPEEGQQPSGTLYPQQVSGQLTEFSRKRTGREVVFSLNGAFVIFVAFLIIAGTVYRIGYNKGVLEEKNRFAVEDNIPENELSAIELSATLKTAYSSVSVEPGRYTLKVLSLKRNAASLSKLKSLRNALLSVPVIENSKLETLVYENSGSNRYTLGIGVFQRSDDPALEMLVKYIRQTPPKPLGENRLSVSVERVDDLGRPMP